MRALICSSGGSKGSFHAGAIKYLLGDIGINYDIFAGVSAGAIAAGFLAQFPEGKEKEASNELCRLWLSISTDKIYKKAKLLGLHKLLTSNSLYDSSPLHTLIKQNISLDRIRSSGKKVIVGAISLNSGKYTNFTEKDDSLIDAIIASCSFPGAFSPVAINGQLWVDGAGKCTLPTKTVMDIGATHIDAIVSYPEKRIPMWISNPGAIDILKRVFDLSLDKIMYNDIEQLMLHNLVNINKITFNLIQPKTNLVEESLDFCPLKIKDMMIRGYDDAKSYFQGKMLSII